MQNRQVNKFNILNQPLSGIKAFLDVKKYLKEDKSKALLSGVSNSYKAQIISALEQKQVKLVISGSESRAKELVRDLRFFGENAHYYPAKDLVFYLADVHSNDIAMRRIKIFKKLIEGERLTIVLSVDALLDKLIPLEVFKKGIIEFEVGKTVDFSAIAKNLGKIGYSFCEQVDSVGQFRIRGGILDIYPSTENTMYRIEFFDNEVDSIRDLNAETKRSIGRHEKITIYPASEFVIDDLQIESALRALKKDYEETKANIKADNKKVLEELNNLYFDLQLKVKTAIIGSGIENLICYFYEDMIGLVEMLGEPLVYLDEPIRIEERLDYLTEEYDESIKGRILSGKILSRQIDIIFGKTDFLKMMEKKKVIMISNAFETDLFINQRKKFSFDSITIPAYHNRYDELIKDLRAYSKKNYKMLLLSPSVTRARRLASMLRNDGIKAYTSREDEFVLASGAVLVAYGTLSSGYAISEAGYAILTESDSRSKPKSKRSKNLLEGSKVESHLSLKTGDYVVHEEHGIGVFEKIDRIEIDGVEKDFIKINYQKNSNLYIGITNLGSIRKYVCKEGKKPRISKLGSNEWVNTKARVKKAIEEVAGELVDLYAKRQSLKGYRYSEDNSWQIEFEETFPYEETKDQLHAIRDTKSDMESAKIMDRLICGDVGYGKTEVAIRAAFKAVNDSKQVAYLVPTTILAQQHYNNFMARMEDYPIRVELLSRFRTRKEQLETIKRCKRGETDIVIGTHRLLSKDVKFKDLGLLIIDEEQRFGVKHKESIKKLKNTVDVMALTATPIPRTLHMSLIGIRDMSVLLNPPHERVPVRTYVLERTDEVIKDAISRELKRGGQVYYVYNKIKDIDEVAFKISELVKEASVSYAHGRMGERQLENIMIDFIDRKIDVLVATTIIETGLDIANVNAIIIDDADKLGLSQLYQLRGRVGRSNREAFAYLMYRKDRILKEEAKKRLEAIKEFTQFGAGYKIALRDLEIRGAGDLLGKKQSGHMEAVGYELYVKMLEEKVRQLKDEDYKVDDFETNIDLRVSAFIPSSYIKSEIEKLDIYKKISLISSYDDFLDIADELIDRFSDIPPATLNLLKISLLKSRAHDLKIKEIKSKNTSIKFSFKNDAPINSDKIAELLNAYNNRLKFKILGTPTFTYTKNKDYDEIEIVNKVISDFEKIRTTPVRG